MLVLPLAAVVVVVCVVCACGGPGAAVGPHTVFLVAYHSFSVVLVCVGDFGRVPLLSAAW